MNDRTTNEILIHHLTAFGNNDLDEIMNDYTEDSELLTAEGRLKGLSTIRQFFVDYFVIIPSGSMFEMKKLTVTRDVAFILWASDSNVAHIPLGTDTFFIEKGKIKWHTVAAHIVSK